jgi:hypothetical protein
MPRGEESEQLFGPMRYKEGCMGNSGGFRWFAWWYAAISLGFLLLAISRAITGERAWLIAIRLIISAGFAVFAWFEFHGKARR